MTTQATHTPGPWKEKRKLAIYSADDEPICAVFPAETEERSKADARLIAAAPDLLEALKNAREWLDELAGLVQSGMFDAAEDWAGANAVSVDSTLAEAIAKAEGRAE